MPRSNIPGSNPGRFRKRKIRYNIPSPYGHGGTTGTVLPSDNITRHQGGSNIGYLDGHVKWLRWQKILIMPERGSPMTTPKASRSWWPRYGTDQ